MMKRIIVLMLVLGLAGAANAGSLSLDISVGGAPYGGEDLDVGTIVDVAIVQAAADATGSGGELTVNLAGTPGAIVDGAPMFSWTTYLGWNWLFSASPTLMDNGDGTFAAWTGKTGNINPPHLGTPGIGSVLSMGAPNPYANTTAFSFAATETTDLVYGGIWDSVDLTGVVGGTVNVVPEPMTIALLGLGGLFLRRRK